MQRKRFLTMILLTALIAIAATPATANSADVADFGFANAPTCEKSFSRNNIFVSELSSSALGPRVFQGCWTFFSAGPCRAIYSKNGGYEICGECDYYGNPGGGPCSSISQQTLNHGYWCS